MRFDGRAFLESAAYLAAPAAEELSPAREEADLRSSISRSYYAAFWSARGQYLADGEYLTHMDAHQTVIAFFRMSRYRARMTIGVHLAQLRFQRNRADYDSSAGNLTDLRRHAEQCLHLATLVLTALDQIERER